MWCCHSGGVRSWVSGCPFDLGLGASDTETTEVVDAMVSYPKKTDQR